MAAGFFWATSAAENVVRNYLRIDVCFPNPAGNQLSILSTEINYEDCRVNRQLLST